MSDKFEFDPEEFEQNMLDKHGIRTFRSVKDDDSDEVKFVKIYEFVPVIVEWLNKHGFEILPMNGYKKEKKTGGSTWQMRVVPRGSPRKKNLPYDIGVIQIPTGSGLYKVKHDQQIHDPYVRGIEQLDEAWSIFQEYATGTGTLADFDF